MSIRSRSPSARLASDNVANAFRFRNCEGSGASSQRVNHHNPRRRALFAVLPMLLFAGCQSGSGSNAIPGDADETAAYAGIAAGERIEFTGTEPFWGGEIEGDVLRYSTPENIEGTRISVERFAGRGGVSFAGSLNGADFDLMLTEGECGDGMSDRSYPFVATLSLGGSVRNGCAWTASRPFTGPQNP